MTASTRSIVDLTTEVASRLGLRLDDALRTALAELGPVVAGTAVSIAADGATIAASTPGPATAPAPGYRLITDEAIQRCLVALAAERADRHWLQLGALPGRPAAYTIAIGFDGERDLAGDLAALAATGVVATTAAAIQEAFAVLGARCDGIVALARPGAPPTWALRANATIEMVGALGARLGVAADQLALLDRLVGGGRVSVLATATQRLPALRVEVTGIELADAPALLASLAPAAPWPTWLDVLTEVTGAAGVAVELRLADRGAAEVHLIAAVPP